MTTGALQQLIFEPPAPELSRVLKLEQINGVADTIIIDATPQECMSLAERFDLPHLRNLTAEVTHRRIRSGQMIRIEGRITANYSQLCSATALPMPVMMEESFYTEYTLGPWEKYSEFDLDQPEVLTDDYLDLGEVVAQYFGLGIDPFRRRPNTETLSDLADDITAAVAELTRQTEVAIAPLATPAPTLAEPEAEVPTNDNLELMTEDEPQEPEFMEIEMTVEIEEPAMEIPEQETAAANAPRESLFHKYLREMQQK